MPKTFVDSKSLFESNSQCCNVNGGVKSTIDEVRKDMCMYFNEMVTYNAAAESCAAQGSMMCPEVYTWDQILVGCSMDMALWLKGPARRACCGCRSAPWAWSA